MSIDTLMDWGGTPPKFPGNAPRKIDLEIYGNTTWSNTIEFKDTSDDTPIDISNYVFTLTIKRNEFDKKALKVLTLGDGLSVIGTDKNILLINILFDLRSGNYVYDLKGTTDGGETIPYLKGKIKKEEDV